MPGEGRSNRKKQQAINSIVHPFSNHPSDIPSSSLATDLDGNEKNSKKVELPLPPWMLAVSLDF